MVKSDWMIWNGFAPSIVNKGIYLIRANATDIITVRRDLSFIDQNPESAGLQELPAGHLIFHCLQPFPSTSIFYLRVPYRPPSLRLLLPVQAIKICTSKSAWKILLCRIIPAAVVMARFRDSETMPVIPLPGDIYIAPGDGSNCCPPQVIQDNCQIFIRPRKYWLIFRGMVRVSTLKWNKWFKGLLYPWEFRCRNENASCCEFGEDIRDQ